MRYARFLGLLAVPLIAGCSTLDSLVPDISMSSVGIGAPAIQPAKTPALPSATSLSRPRPEPRSWRRVAVLLTPSAPCSLH